MTTSKEQIKESVRESYAAAARGLASATTTQTVQAREPVETLPTASSCCGPTQTSSSCCAPTQTQSDPGFGSALYENLGASELPDSVTLASLGCGNPTAVAALNPGEVVLDLGSGAGLDVMLSAKRVGPTGKAYGLDMTDEMLDLARKNQEQTGVENVEFLKGDIEDVPLPDDSVDVVISNCVINLSADKNRVFEEASRVLVTGGRFAVTDVLASRPFTDAEKADMTGWSECITGALTEQDFISGLTAAGFHDIDIEVTHPVADNAVSAIVRAVRN